jgi:predicted alpha/beta superfamily hydrolase
MAVDSIVQQSPLPPRHRLRNLLLFVSALALVAAIPFVLAYRSVATVETAYVVRSDILWMNRQISVYVPAAYDSQGTRRYAVLYSLDGQSFRHNRLPAIWVRVLSAAGLTEPLIVVAIHGEGTRDTDFRPPSPVPAHNDPPIAGRDEAFTAFLRDELFPFIDRRYRTSAYRIISGHSLGGFFAVDRLSRSPGLFQAHFAYSPTFSHDRASLPRLRAAVAMPRSEPALLYMNIGEENGLNYMTYFRRAARIVAVRQEPPSVVARSERHRGMFHPIVMIPGQARALMWWGGQVNRCAIAAATAAVRQACYTRAAR